MAIERKWEAVASQLTSSDGNTIGEIQVPLAYLFKVGQIIQISSNTQDTIELKVKRISNITTLELGAPKQGIFQREDISNYLVADGASVRALEQSRSNISPDDVIRAVYSEEPTMAIRNILVDASGNYLGLTPDNPIHAQLSTGSITIDTVDAQLEVHLSHINTPGGNPYDSVRIGDGVDLLNINPDGSLNINSLPTNTSYRIETTFNEVALVPTSTNTILHTFTAPANQITYLDKIIVSGENIATYTILKNGDVIDRGRTYFGSSLDKTFDFQSGDRGILLDAGDIITVSVYHTRPDAAPFNARIQTAEI